MGYGYWGHDIGGHMQKRGHERLTDPEMYTRWLQYGVFTPIFKTHSTQSANLERKIWAFPSHFEYMKEAIRLRYTLSPYIYTFAREAYDTGVSLCRPLYYAYPEQRGIPLRGPHSRYRHRGAGRCRWEIGPRSLVPLRQRLVGHGYAHPAQGWHPQDPPLCH